MESVDSLEKKLATYDDQLEKVNEMYAKDVNDENIGKLREDLVEVISLTKDMLEERYAAEGKKTQTDGLGKTSSADWLKIGCTCEVKGGDVWYPGVIKNLEIKENDHIATIKYIGFEGEVQLSTSSLRGITNENPMDGSKIVKGLKCLARYFVDGRYYKATISDMTDYGYKVYFDDYHNTEEVPIEYLKPLEPKVNKKEIAPKLKETSLGGAAKMYVIDDSDFKVPDNLKIEPTDSETEKQKKKKKLKAIKNKYRQVVQEQERDVKKSNWQNFVTKGRKAAKGALTNKRKGSIFASPTNVDGRVGVTNSGRGMTNFDTRKKFKLDEEKL